MRRDISITNPLTADEQRAGLKDDPATLTFEDLGWWINSLSEDLASLEETARPSEFVTRLAELRNEMKIRTEPRVFGAATKDGHAIVHAIDQMGDKIVAYYMKSVAIMERVYAHQLRNPGPTINIVEEHRNWNTYHVGGLLCNQGQSPGGVLSITAHLRPLMADVAIVVGSPSATPLPDACLTKINGWAMSVATAKLLVATVQQAIRDVEDATSKEPHADSQDR